MHKVIVFLCLSLGSGSTAHAQKSAFRGNLNLRPLAQADSASRFDARPLFVYIYIKSCPACRSYEAGTLSDILVLGRLNADFHVSAIDAGSRRAVEWRGRLFEWDRATGINGAAALLSKGSHSYPVTALVSPDGSWHQSIPGDIGKGELLCLLAYASEEAWKSQSYDVFRERRMGILQGSRQ